MVTTTYPRDLWGRLVRYTMNINTILVSIVIALVVGQLLSAWRQAQPPLVYSQAAYIPAPNVVKPGDVMHWTSHLDIVEAPVTLTTNYSIWNETCNHPAQAGTPLTERLQYVPASVSDYAVVNNLVVPVLPPGLYRLTRQTWGIKNGGVTAITTYDVYFTVSGSPAPCTTFDRQ